MKLVAVIAALVVFGSCTSEPEPRRSDPVPAPEARPSESPRGSPAPTPTQAGGTADQTIPIQLWFLRGGDRRPPELLLHYEELPATRAVGRAAIQLLIRGVPERAPKKAYSIVPSNTDLLGLTIANRTATIDLSRGFEQTEAGTAVDGMQVAQVVYTLTQFPTVKRVELLIEGERVETLGGHGIPVDRPLTRKDFEEHLPPIVVEKPYPGQAVGRTFGLSGIANVFEATVSWRLTDPDRKPFKQGFTTATCGSGCWGSFGDRISLERVPGDRIILEVFESSAEDGSALHLVRVPLRVATG